MEARRRFILILCLTVAFLLPDPVDCMCVEEGVIDDESTDSSSGHTTRTKHLYPNVVVSATMEHQGEVDSDEEDFNLRKNNNNTKPNNNNDRSVVKQ